MNCIWSLVYDMTWRYFIRPLNAPYNYQENTRGNHFLGSYETRSSRAFRAVFEGPTKCGWINRISRRIPLLQGKKVHSDHKFYIILPCAIKHPRVMLFRNLWISRRQPLAWRIYRCAAAEGAETAVSMGQSFANGGCSRAMLDDGGTWNM